MSDVDEPTPEGQEPEGDQPEHQDGDEGGEATEAGSGDIPQPEPEG